MTTAGQRATTVHLVRHATYAGYGERLIGRSTGIRLNDVGRAQAEGLARRFADCGIDLVQSSPRERTMETAAVIAHHIGATHETVAALDEIDFGAWTGKAFDELAGDPQWAAWNVARGANCPPGGESMHAAQARIVAHIDRLRRTRPRAQTILVSHCDIIKAALLHMMDLAPQAYERFDIDPASISTLSIGSGVVAITALNEPAAGALS